MMHTLHILALNDAWYAGMGVFEAIFSTIVTVILWRINQNQKRFTGMEDRVRTGEERLHSVTTKLVDERFRAFTHEINGHVQGLVNTVDDLKVRLQDGDGAFNNLRDGDHKLELELKDGLHNLERWVRDEAASRKDVKDHQESVQRRFDIIGEKLGQLGQQISTLDATIKTRRDHHA